MNSLRETHKEFMKNNRLTLKSQQRFRSEKHNVFTVFTVEVRKIALSANNDKRIQSIDSVETQRYGTNEKILHRKKIWNKWKNIIQEKKDIKCNNITKQYEKWLTITILQKKM